MTIKATISGEGEPDQVRQTHNVPPASRYHDPLAGIDPTEPQYGTGVDDDMRRQAADRRATVAAQDERSARARAAGF